MRRKVGLAVAVLAAAAATALATAMAMTHMQQGAGGWYAGMCNVDATFLGLPIDCQAVNSSSYSKLYGIPVAILGSGFYTALVGLGVVALIGREPLRTKAAQIVIAGSAGSVFYSLLLLMAQIIQIGALCPLCISLYALQAVIFVGAFAAVDFAGEPVLRGLWEMVRQPHREPVIWIPALITAGIVGVMVAASAPSADGAVPESAALRSKLALAERIELQPAADDAAVGPLDADYLIVEFSDFMCPFCRKAAFDAQKLKQDVPNRLRLVFKHYPLDTSCNPHLSRNMHPGACDAAAAAVCANQVNRFWPFHDALFARQKDIFSGDVRANLAAEGEKIGLSAESFLACMDEPDIRARVRADIDAAYAIGVRGTPAFLVNGHSFFTGPLQLGAGSIGVARMAIAEDLLLR